MSDTPPLLGEGLGAAAGVIGASAAAEPASEGAGVSAAGVGSGAAIRDGPAVYFDVTSMGTWW